MKRSVFLVLATLLFSACAHRPAAIGEDANYLIEVTNPTNAAMNISLDMGAGQMSALGQVPAGETRRFEVRNPSTNDVVIIAADASGENPHRFKVELSRSKVAQVRLEH